MKFFWHRRKTGPGNSPPNVVAGPPRPEIITGKNIDGADCSVERDWDPDFLKSIAHREHQRLARDIGAEAAPFCEPSFELMSSRIWLNRGYSAFKADYNKAEQRLCSWRKVNPRLRVFLALDNDLHGKFMALQLRGFLPTTVIL